MNRKQSFAETQTQAKEQKFGYTGTGNPRRQRLRHANVWTVLLISVLLLTASCAEKSTYSEQTAKNEQTVKQYFEHFNNHDWQKMADMYVDNAEFKDPAVGTEIFKMPKQEIVAKYSELGEMFPDLKDRVIKTYPSGDKHIIVEFVTAGTAPDSSKMEMPICTIFTVENGKITQDLSYYDNF
ncbi:MAG: nuclear transport factor 2 family protein [Prevotellaceae bacterium]|jgi:ketosteroid isomerase-like protein|nr:nuclear transport factor 2 family protein [Prevotellaceae bacterium]